MEETDSAGEKNVQFKKKKKKKKKGLNDVSHLAQICSEQVCGMYAGEVEQGHYLLHTDGSLSV